MGGNKECILSFTTFLFPHFRYLLVHQWEDGCATCRKHLTNQQGNFHFLVYSAFSHAAAPIF